MLPELNCTTCVQFCVAIVYAFMALMCADLAFTHQEDRIIRESLRKYYKSVLG